jgi:hypothetical protein
MPVELPSITLGRNHKNIREYIYDKNNNCSYLRVSCACGVCADEHHNDRNDNGTSNDNTDNEYNLHSWHRDNI